MTHVKLLALKFVITLGILFIILGLGFDVSFGNVFLISLVVSALGYLGDVMILKKSNNTMATAGDFVLSFAVIYFMTDALTVGDDVFEATLISAISLAIFEYFFHQSVARSLDQEKEENHEVRSTGQLQTEASEELFPYEEEDKEK
ncbi:YndM family protein [Halobacillus sp. HZG1]|uniref:YndM family protein n=1 Tax=Halobacillus sp. HZG1 TaxID=3111769 RepID=UPI002DB5B556|nr:YndM family protein [Halobacillus sp. HZG1]MEC3885766.1 YndM family protein [Halobacillus sp. HZG1]